LGLDRASIWEGRTIWRPLLGSPGEWLSPCGFMY
jgi:hypothetical protein